MSKSLAITKLYLGRLKPAYITVAICFIANLIPNLIFLFDPDLGNQGGGLSSGNMLALLPLLSAILVPSRNLRKTMNLGARRSDFFWGCLPLYALLSAGAAFIMIAYHALVDPALVASGSEVEIIDVTQAFGFYDHGLVLAGVQLFVFLLMFTLFVHTLVLSQTAWYGWVADIVIVSIISVFTPIPVLRAAEVWFFNLFIFGNMWAQIGSCVLLAAVFYALSWPVLSRRRV